MTFYLIYREVGWGGGGGRRKYGEDVDKLWPARAKQGRGWFN